jgi:hypothetical protein
MPDGQPPVYDPNTRRAPLMPVTPHAGTYGAPPSTSSGGAGFKYDVATLRELMNDWNAMANEFQDDQTRARYLAQTQGPGLEYASEGNADQIRKSGKALLTTLTEREEYCRAMANKFRTALGKYASTEDSHSTAIKQTGGSL